MRGINGNLVDTLFSRSTVHWTDRTPSLSLEETLEMIATGGYPPAVARSSTARRDAWFQSYVMTMLQRDIRDMANIADTTAIPRLLSIVAARAGGLLNFADLSRTMTCANDPETLLCAP